MTAQQLYAKIETPISLPNNGITDSMLSKITRFRSSIDQIKEENLDLERMRDQYIIHLQQCQEDHEILRNIYKSLKQKLDRATLSLDSGGGQNRGADDQQAQQATGNAAAASQDALAIKPYNPEVKFLNTTPGLNVTLKGAFMVDDIICAVAYNKQGTQIAFSAGTSLFVLDSAAGKLVTQIDLPPPEKPASSSRAIAFSPDGNYIALSVAPFYIYIVNIQEKAIKKTLTGGTLEISSLLYNSEGTLLISGNFDGSIIVWDTANYTEKKRIPPKDKDSAIVGIATSPEDSYYAVASSAGKFTIYTSEFENTTSFDAHKENMLGIAVSPLDETIATVSQDMTVKVWVLRVVATLKSELKGHTDYTLTACFSPDTPLLFSGSKDQTIRIWNYKKGELKTTIAAHVNTVFSIAHHPKSNQFVSVGGDHMCCIWEYNEQ
ncbi:hypothetical protein TVAG_202810 [Trichomonas vaginalis G3]|uniref:Uncharacterized protein n=1 Tax=Trichomonas vaginalis (strain ATCC PRA-98 / G3) TaxID=412133 RepID=A2ENF3_TRIV3|nr:WD repeat-containing protein family [Trichomonas vaginalis G3]EAY05823.1 hypothetical protein TVAG_202810 [Trichomonas vaginalis G3]KAI5516374.1 WD repeat-containing protein family [Trichomonas vaginalis G3]|eukprot:XP_001318046.1 hypothetical protein [Trichomonas vaginalis G3]